MKVLLSSKYLLPNLDDMIDCTKAQETANFESMFGKQTGIKASFLLFFSIVVFECNQCSFAKSYTMP